MKTLLATLMFFSLTAHATPGGSCTSDNDCAGAEHCDCERALGGECLSPGECNGCSSCLVPTKPNDPFAITIQRRTEKGSVVAGK